MMTGINRLPDHPVPLKPMFRNHCLVISLQDTYGTILDWMRKLDSAWLTRTHTGPNPNVMREDLSGKFASDALRKLVYMVCIPLFSEYRGCFSPEQGINRVKDLSDALTWQLKTITEDDHEIARFKSIMELAIVSEICSFIPTFGTGYMDILGIEFRNDFDLHIECRVLQVYDV